LTVSESKNPNWRCAELQYGRQPHWGNKKQQETQWKRGKRREIVPIGRKPKVAEVKQHVFFSMKKKMKLMEGLVRVRGKKGKRKRRQERNWNRKKKVKWLQKREEKRGKARKE